MSWFSVLNWFILQWLFIRLDKYTQHGKSGSSWFIIAFVLPLTGWWSEYIYVWHCPWFVLYKYPGHSI